MRGISVALTTFNGAKYLEQQLDSILNQNLNFQELVICDDKSTDSTPMILERYAQMDKRIKVYSNQVNLGFKENFERAINICKGDYIALCDQDDIWKPNHLETLLNGIGSKMLACGDAEIIDKEGNLQNKKLSEIKNLKKLDNNESFFQFLAYYQNPFQGASMLLRRDFIEKVLPIPENVKYHDVWFAINACLLDSFIFINEPVTLYRLHNNNASGEHKHKSVIRTIAGHFVKSDLKTNRKEIFEELSDRNNFSPEARNLIQEACRYYKSRSIKARFENLLFEIFNYKSIYGK